MPELPEVETIRNDLKRFILRKIITKVIVNKPKQVKSPLRQFAKTLVGNQFIAIERVGKLLIFKLASEHYLLIHLKMTGQLIYQSKKKTIAGGHSWPVIDLLPNKYSHVIFEFDDGSRLFFNDLRQFGYLQIVDVAGKIKQQNKYGIEPLQPDFTHLNFTRLLAGKKTVLKSLLLNQKFISGLGNIYVDEVCYQARVLPTRPANTLTTAEIKRLHQACQIIISRAIIKRGTTFSDYRDGSGRKGNYVRQLKVYGRSGQRCRRCRDPIVKIKLNGRGTHFCPRCQI